MNLVLDIGNTSTKMACFEDDTLLSVQTVKSLDAATMSFFCGTKQPEHVYASVVGPMPCWEKVLPPDVTVQTIDATLPLPFENDYKTPLTLGNDRVAAMVGALALYKQTPLLVIDAGSCITLDYLDERNHYLGGAIMPGLQMKLNALHTFTDRLPLIDLCNVEQVPLVGDDTQQCITAGTLTATILALEAFITKYRRLSSKPMTVVLTGGDSQLLQSHIDDKVERDPYLVLHGTNAIFRNR